MTENRTDREKMVSGVGEEEPGKIDDALLPEPEGVFSGQQTVKKTGLNKEERAYRWMVRRKKGRLFIKKWLATVIAAFFAILFLMPIVLTITNSFMSSSEISSNYGQVFSTSDTGGKTYISEKVNLKFIPDMVSFSQYITVLFKSPDYLFKFWNSVILVGPIVFFQLMVAVLASYGFTRYRGRIKEIIFFIYIIKLYYILQNCDDIKECKKIIESISH